MNGKLCVVTGATSGIGEEIARGLVRLGARAVIVARNPKKAAVLVAKLAHESRGSVEVLEADLSSLERTRRVAGEILDRFPKIDVLVSNAGVYRMRRATTADGYEETFAVNHLAPFLLTNLLADRLRESAPARIVITASGAHQGARLDFGDLLLERTYSSWRAYSRSKLANIMFTYALARRLVGSGVTVNCFHPGFVSSSLGSGNGLPVRPFYVLLKPFTISPEKGADTAVWLASSPSVEGIDGKYFYKRRETRSNTASQDEDGQERLWKESAALVGL